MRATTTTYMLKAAPASAAPNGSAATVPSGPHRDTQGRRLGVSGRAALAELQADTIRELEERAKSAEPADRAALLAAASYIAGLRRELLRLDAPRRRSA